MSVQEEVSRLSVEDKRRLVAELLKKKQAGQPRTTFPLSFGQQAMWFLHQLSPGNAAYNFAYAARMRSAVDAAALARSFQQQVDRHPALRTVYETQPEGPVQRVLPKQEV